MIKRSIAMPSHRPEVLSHEAIWSAENHCLLRRKSHELFISDNSGDDTKFSTKAVKSNSISMLENFMSAFNGTTGDFVLIMGDDDRICSLGTKNIEVANDVIGIQPHISAYTTEHGIIRVDASPITEETAYGRVEQFHRICQGIQLGFFTFWRRDVLGDMLDLWCNHHPTKGAYVDWAFMRGMVSSGKTVFDPSTIYFKNIDNWYGDQDKIDKEAKKLYRDAGISEEFTQYDAIFKAIDSFIFINRKSSPVDKYERLKAAQSCIANTSFHQISEILQICNLLSPYKEFYKHATGCEWSTIY